MNRPRSPDSPFQRNLGYGQGPSDLARFALNPSEKQQLLDRDGSKEAWAYPSPPMSGSPPLPPKLALEAHHGQPPRSFHSNHSDDGRQSTASQQPYVGYRESLPVPPAISRGYPPEPPASSSRSSDRSFDSSSIMSPYSSQPPAGYSAQRPYSPHSLPSATTSYAVMNRQPPPRETGPYGSPKAQRKTKGHVASACVPCKKAHLRCDAQRPCSRCLSNGKEEACVDVQHKKRGRPRLRDDPEARYDTSRFPHPQDVASRRPLSIYPSVTHLGSIPGREGNSSPSYQSRPHASEGHGFPPLTIPSRPAEAMAYLSMDMDIINVSPTFLEALSAHELKTRRFFSIVSHIDQDKIRSLQGLFLEEQKRREPNYLPPILGRGDQIIQRLGFSMGDLGRFLLERQEMLTFMAGDGQPRPYSARIGLAKEDSFYFIVVSLSIPPRYPYPSPSPHSRETTSAYHVPPGVQQHTSAFTQHTALSATFEPARHRLSEGSVQSRTSSGPPHFGGPSTLSPGVSPSTSSYSPDTIRSDYLSVGSGHIPRSELPPPARPPSEPSAYQLPPMRSQPDIPSPVESKWPREERSGRLDIGGLIEKPEGQARPY